MPFFCKCSTLTSILIFSIHFSKSVETAPSAPTTGITVTLFMFHMKVEQVLIFLNFLLFFRFHPWISLDYYIDHYNYYCYYYYCFIIIIIIIVGSVNQYLPHKNFYLFFWRFSPKEAWTHLFFVQFTPNCLNAWQSLQSTLISNI